MSLPRAALGRSVHRALVVAQLPVRGPVVSHPLTLQFFCMPPAVRCNATGWHWNRQPFSSSSAEGKGKASHTTNDENALRRLVEHLSYEQSCDLCCLTALFSLFTLVMIPPARKVQTLLTWLTLGYARAILEEALLNVPQHGWSLQAIISGVKAQGLSPSAHGMFARCVLHASVVLRIVYYVACDIPKSAPPFASSRVDDRVWSYCTASDTKCAESK